MEWKEINGFIGLYEISNGGVVKSCKRNIHHPINGTVNLREKILKPEYMRDGYLRITLCKDGETFRFPIHVLVANAFVENPYNYTIVNHKDENRRNNHYENLEWCNMQYNLEYSLSRHYIVTDTNGLEHEVFNLSNFCKIHSLSITAMSEMATGRIPSGKRNPRKSHKGWKCRYADNCAQRGVMKHAC